MAIRSPSAKLPLLALDDHLHKIIYTLQAKVARNSGGVVLYWNQVVCTADKVLHYQSQVRINWIKLRVTRARLRITGIKLRLLNQVALTQSRVSIAEVIAPT